MPSLRSPRDDQLVDRIAAGEIDAWETVDRRYRPALRRYVAARSWPGTVDPDDVVQDVLMRAFDLLRAGHGPSQLRPWLYRLCRNATIDVIRARSRRRHEELSGHEVADSAVEPEPVLLRRERLRQITADVAQLPDRQRTALLARAVDGWSTAEIGAELGIGDEAVHMVVRRARESLMRSELARDAACETIRPMLVEAHEHKARPKETARLHLKTCAGCRTYREELRRVDRQLQALAPPIVPVLAVLAAHAGLSTKAATIGIATAGTAAVAVTGGLILLGGVQRHDAGEPAPFRLTGMGAFAAGKVVKGAPVPGRTSIVTAKVRMPPPPSSSPREDRQFVTLQCPSGMIVGGLEAAGGRSDIRWDPNPPILERPERQARMELIRPRDAKRDTVTVGIVCRRPDANGSIVRHPRTARRGERAAHICLSGSRAQRAAAGLPANNQLFAEPGKDSLYEPMDGTPISIQRSTSNHRWSYAITDDPSMRGWISRRLICR